MVDSLFTLTQPTELAVSASISNNDCATDSLGVIELNTVGGVGGYNFSWSTSSGYASTNDTITQLHSDTFNLSIVDGNLCQLDTLFIVTSPDSIFANITLTDANCGFSDGNAVANPFGGTITTNYIFDWDNDGVGDNDDNAAISNLIAGTYNLTIIDDNNCSVDTSIIITNTTGPQISINSVTDPTCSGGEDGAIDITISGGNLPYNIYWNPHTTSQSTSISNLPAGNHIVNVIDNVGCVATDTVVLNEPSPIIIDLTLSNSTCQSCDGSASANITGGNPSAVYNTLWSNGNTGNISSNLCSGVYSLQVADNLGCSKDTSFTISDDLTSIVANPTVVSPTCPNATDGSITISPTGGVGPYNYLWIDNGNTSSSLNNLSSGIYQVMITDDNGCSETVSVTLSNNTAVIDVTANILPANCNSNNGSIKVIPNGGSSPYLYNWSNGSASDSIFNLSAGLYSLTITDNNGCSEDFNFGVTNFNDLTVSTSSTNVNCHGENTGSIAASVAGNTGSITETWFDNNGATIGNGATISNLVAGEYTYLVVDDITGCQHYEYITILQSEPIAVSLANTSNASCEVSCDGEADLVVSGGNLPYTYLWNNGSTANNVTNLCVGSNSVLITDASGCNYEQALTIQAENTLSFSSNTVNSTCGACDGIGNLTAIGGSGNETFTWFDGVVSGTHTNLCSGIYGFELLDNTTGCSIVSSIEVSDAGGPSNQIVNTVNPTCFGLNDGSASVIASGGTPPYSYYWVPGGQSNNVITNLGAGLYHLEIIDENNCKLVVPVSISNPSSPTVEHLSTDANCGVNNGAISIVVYQGAGSYTYSWNGPNGFSSTSKDIANLEAGLYELTISDINGCQYVYNYTINSIGGFTLDITATNVSCFGLNDGNVISAINGGSGNFSYSWSNGASTANLTNVGAGIYSLTVTDINTNCISSDYVDVFSPDSISVSTPFVVEPNCYGDNNGQASVAVSGGNNVYAVTWVGIGAGFEQANLGAGNYDITVTDLNGCTTTQSIQISEPDSIQIITDQIIDAYCIDQNDGEIYISVIGGNIPYNYNWIDTSGTYNNTTDQDIDNLYPGTYVITIIDNNLCTNTDTIILNAENVIIADAGLDSSICIGNCMDIFGSAQGVLGVTYEWNIVDSVNVLSTDSLIPNYCFNDTSNIKFVLKVTDQGCSDYDTVEIVVHPLPVIDAGNDIDDIYGATINLGGSPTGPVGSTYNWTPDVNFINQDDTTIANPDVTVLANETYFVTVTDINGCQNSDDINVTLIPDISYSSGFSPNNDGVNDTWAIEQIDQFPNCNVEIYNRWGTLLFKSTGYNEQWGGVYNDKVLPIGTYYYVIELNDPLFPDPITGPITIIR